MLIGGNIVMHPNHEKKQKNNLTHNYLFDLIFLCNIWVLLFSFDIELKKI